MPSRNAGAPGQFAGGAVDWVVVRIAFSPSMWRPSPRDQSSNAPRERFAETTRSCRFARKRLALLRSTLVHFLSPGADDALVAPIGILPLFGVVLAYEIKRKPNATKRTMYSFRWEAIW